MNHNLDVLRPTLLIQLANAINVPQLKSYYRTSAYPYAQENTLPKGWCMKCMLDKHERDLKVRVKPLCHRKLLRKYMVKQTLNKNQRRRLKKLKTNSQALISICNMCNARVRVDLLKPLKKEKEDIIDLTQCVKKSKKKRKRQDELAGINPAVVEECTREISFITKDYISLQPTPQKKRKHDSKDNVIEIDSDTSVTESNKAKRKKATEKESDFQPIFDTPVQTNKKKKKAQHAVESNNNDIMHLEQEKTKLAAIRNSESSKTLSINQKRKMKHKLKVLNDTIMNKQKQSMTPKSILHNFLNSI